MCYKMVMKTKNYGYVRKNDVEDRHLQKSKAGRFFALDPDVESVWVGNEEGKTALYLKKDPVTGRMVMREEYDI